jgi:hypothetical protein
MKITYLGGTETVVSGVPEARREQLRQQTKFDVEIAMHHKNVKRLALYFWISINDC